MPYVLSFTPGLVEIGKVGKFNSLRITLACGITKVKSI
jgi:hypothetical protein